VCTDLERGRSTAKLGEFKLTLIEGNLFNSTTIARFGQSVLDSPLSLVWAPCPYVAASPSPSPSATTIGGAASSSSLGVALSVSLVIIFIILVACCCVALVWLLVRGRRRYYVGSEGNGEGQSSDMEMNDITYTFREVNFDDLKLGRELGRGAFGRVYRGEYRYVSNNESHARHMTH
jgi:hypothetical protein